MQETAQSQIVTKFPQPLGHHNFGHPNSTTTSMMNKSALPSLGRGTNYNTQRINNLH